MKAVIGSVHGMRLGNAPMPKIESATDAVIKITTSSICASDFHNMEHLEDGEDILGHEYCGVVIETGTQVSNLKPGDRVAGRPVAYCGHCYYCQRHQEGLCEKAGILPTIGAGPGQRNSGTQAEYARIAFADYTLAKIPDGLSDEQVIFVGDILSTGFSAIHRAQPGLGDTITVFGCGPVGLCALATAPLFGPGQVIAVDLLDYRLDAARHFGATVVNASKEDAVARIKEMTAGRGSDLGVEAAGAAPSLKSCMQSTRPGGKVSIVGTPPPGTQIDISERFFDMFTLTIGLGEQSYVDQLMALIQGGKLDLSSLITHTFPLAEAVRAYEIFGKQKDNCIKVILKP